MGLDLGKAIKNVQDNWHKGLTMVAAASAVFYGFGGADVTLAALNGELNDAKSTTGINDPNYKLPVESFLDDSVTMVADAVDSIGRGLDNFLDDDPSMDRSIPSDGPINPADP